MAEDVLVIGAGAAGLAAAGELSRAGKRALVLEARPRLGGRILTVHDPLAPVPIELGAEFVHGEGSSTVDLLRAARLRVDEVPDDHAVYRRGRFAPLDGFWETVEGMQRDLWRRRRGRDFPVSDYLAGQPPARRSLLREFVEGFHAAPTDRISAASLADPGDSLDQQFRVAAGYGALVDRLAAELDPDRVKVRTGTPAALLRWKKGEVEVESRGGERFRARACVVAIPQALLKAKALRFDPAIPAKERAAAGLETGAVFKIVLRFREPFWGDGERRPNFFHDPGAEVPVWWSARPATAPLLTGWAGGPKGAAMLALDVGSRVEGCLGILSRLFRRPRRDLEGLLQSWRAHDWSADPFSLGAYAYVGVGGRAAQRELARPVAGTLFFAGEALDAEQIGTVAGALATGRRAGRAAARSLF